VIFCIRRRENDKQGAKRKEVGGKERKRNRQRESETDSKKGKKNRRKILTVSTTTATAAKHIHATSQGVDLLFLGLLGGLGGSGCVAAGSSSGGSSSATTSSPETTSQEFSVAFSDELVYVLALELGEELRQPLIIGLGRDRRQESLDVLGGGSGVAASNQQQVSSEVFLFTREEKILRKTR